MTELQQETTLDRIEVKRKTSALGFIGRGISLFIGSIGVLMSLVLIVTIVGIIPGFLMLVGSAGFIALAFGFQNVKCPSCKKVNTVSQRAEDFKCSRCATAVVIDWTKK